MTGARPPLRLAAAKRPVEVALLWQIDDPLRDDSLTELQRDCRALFDVDAALMNGSVGGLVFNPTGEVVPLAIEAATRLQWADARAVLDAVVAAFPGGYPLDLAARELAFGDDEERYEALDALVDGWPSAEVEQRLEALVRDNPSAFWTSYDDRDAEAEALFGLASQLVGEGVWGNAEVAEAALADVEAWAERTGRDDELRRVRSERARMASLRR